MKEEFTKFKRIAKCVAIMDVMEYPPNTYFTECEEYTLYKYSDTIENLDGIYYTCIDDSGIEVIIYNDKDANEYFNLFNFDIISEETFERKFIKV